MTWLTQNYGYDAINRLNSVGDSGYSRGFSYDAYGNMSVSSGSLLNGLTPSSANGYNPIIQRTTSFSTRATTPMGR